MSLITAAEAALAQLKALHYDHEHENTCHGPAHCLTAAAIANLEVEIAKAKREDLGHLSGRSEIPETATVLPASSKPVPWWKQKVTVCDKCFQATCWQGIFMCQQSYEAGTVGFLAWVVWAWPSCETEEC